LSALQMDEMLIYFLDRLTSFPILIGISFYERQSKSAGTITFYDTVAHMAEKVFDTLPRSLKRMSKSALNLNLDVLTYPPCLAFFEGLAGAEADIDAVSLFSKKKKICLDR
jgi:hypothetical protein